MYSDANTIGHMTEDRDTQKWVSDRPADDQAADPIPPAEPVGSAPVPLEPTTVRLDDDTRAFIAAEAKRLGVSDSEVVRTGLAFWRGYLASQRDAGAESRPPE
jgi:hypothetical protein